MINLNHKIQNLFPLLSNTFNSEGKNIKDFCNQITLEAKQAVFNHGDPCQNYLLLISGSVKVFTQSENGKELVLYHIKEGNSCVLTTSCLLSHEKYPAQAITESEVVALAIPVDIFNQFIEQSKPFREFVFKTYSQRLSDLMSVVRMISFSSLESRVAHYLIQKTTDNTADNNEIKTTHQDIAAELGSSREVISRQLKNFENHGWIQVTRGKIAIQNKTAIIKLTQ